MEILKFFILAPRSSEDNLISTWLLIRYTIIGVYVGAATVAAASWWFLFSPEGPQMTWWQLTNYMQERSKITLIFKLIY